MKSHIASMEMRTVRGFGFLLSGKCREKEGTGTEEKVNENMDLFSLLK